MSDQPGSSRLQVLFEAALQDYEKQTGIALAKHPLAQKLQNCDTVESVTAVLREQAQAHISESRGKDKVMQLLKNIVSALCKLSAAADFGQAIGLVRPWALLGYSTSLTLILQHFSPVKAIHTGLAILLSVRAFLFSPGVTSNAYQVVKGAVDSYDALVDLLESMEHFLSHLDIYNKIRPMAVMSEIVFRIVVELLYTLALATKQIEQGKPSGSVFVEGIYHQT
jgi:hypothetical protein